MYIYNALDKKLLHERLVQFRSQTQRFLEGDLSGEAFLPLRLQNGLYIQRHAPMLRIAVPYGMLSSEQLRRLARITRDYDKGYCHLTTRQNIQLNWPRLETIPDLLTELSQVEMHSIQTSGNCIRNITSDPFAGVAKDEIADPRPYCELVRQWSTLNPEFAFLPRKFKIAISGSQQDRALILFHDIGLQITELNDKRGFKVFVGGGLGRTPIKGVLLREFLEEEYLLSYLCAILRVYNQLGRRDNKYKARIKILVRELGIESFREKIEDQWQSTKGFYPELDDETLKGAQQFFSSPNYQAVNEAQAKQQLDEAITHLRGPSQKAFKQWLLHNTREHKITGYRSVTLSLKATGAATGDLSDRQLEVLADLSQQYSFSELRTTQQQNIVLADVACHHLLAVWLTAQQHGLAKANIHTLTDITSCPGGDFCSLANAKSLPLVSAIQKRFDDMDYIYDLGEIRLNVSGCMNACAHHSIADIGILGVDKKGEEFFQIMLGGSSGAHTTAAIGKVVGPSFSAEKIPDAIDTILQTYLDRRIEDELFCELIVRIGIAPFKQALYPKGQAAA